MNKLVLLLSVIGCRNQRFFNFSESTLLWGSKGEVKYAKGGCYMIVNIPKYSEKKLGRARVKNTDFITKCP